jgi:hypothetical protein
MRRIFMVWALGVVGLFGMAQAKGWEMGGEKRGLIPSNVRQAPGGYRSFAFWRGGK